MPSSLDHGEPTHQDKSVWWDKPIHLTPGRGGEAKEAGPGSHNPLGGYLSVTRELLESFLLTPHIFNIYFLYV